MLFHIVKYRKPVAYDNLSKAFPKKNKNEIETIAKASYRNFCDTIIESIKLFSISKHQLIKRMYITDANAAMVDDYYEQQKPLIAISGHFGNWEYSAIMSHYLKYQLIALYSPLKNKFFDKQIKKSRSRFGPILWSNKETEALMQAKFDQLPMYIFIGDQSPSNPKKSYWTDFLNRPTPFLKGTAKAALKYNHPIIQFYIKRVKRGYYELQAEKLVEYPHQLTEDEICEKIARAYEQMVLKEPANWLWTHRRWKHQPPGHMT